MGNRLTKAITILALTCFLVVGAAAASILARASVPSVDADADAVASLANFHVVSNRADKQDRLTVVALASADVEPATQSIPQSVTPVEPQSQPAAVAEPLRQAYASSHAADTEAAKAVEALPVAPPPQAHATLPPVHVQSEHEKPRIASRPQEPKSRPLLSDAQIAGIKQKLRLSSSQEYYWPAVETALRAVAHKVEIARRSNPSATAAQLDPDSPEVQELKSAAMPLLFQLRDDQKEEVRKLARVIGLEKVAAAI